MRGIRSVRFSKKVGPVLAVGAALLLVLAACSPAGSAGTATPGLGLSTEFATSAPTESLGTPLATEAATSAATELSTSAATEAATSAATEMSTSAATSAATEAETSVANSTAAGTEAANAPLLIESDKLLGMSVNDNTGTSVGTVIDVMVDTTGTVQAVVLNLSASGSAAGTPAATSASSTEVATAAATTGVSTQAAANANTVAVPWASIKADPTTQQLVYQGAAADLASMTKFDESKVSDGYIIRAQTAGVSSTYDGLIRLGGSLTDINLQTPANEKLGDMQHVIIDMHSGMATYAVVDFGGFLGIASQSVMVPWNKLQLDNTDMTTTKPVLRLNVTKSSLTSAPKFDESTLSFWPTPANNDWDSKIQLFWQTAAQ